MLHNDLQYNYLYISFQASCSRRAVYTDLNSEIPTIHKYIYA